VSVPKRRWRDLGWSELLALVLIPVIIFGAVFIPTYVVHQQQTALSERFASLSVALQSQHALLEEDIQQSIRELRCILTISAEHRNPVKLHRCAARA
jgi:hypothetical protein